MAQVEKLELDHSFQDDVINQSAGRAPVNPKALDQTLVKTVDNVNLINDNLQLIQRDDGQLRDGSVGLEQIKTEIINIIKNINLRGAYSANQYYAINDCVDFNGSKWVCKTAHNSTELFVEPNWLRFGYMGSEDASHSAYLAQIAATKAEQAQKNSSTNAQTVANYVSSASAAAATAAANAKTAADNASVTLENASISTSARDRAEAAAMGMESLKHSSVYVPDGGAGVAFLGGVFRGYETGINFISDTGHAPIGMTGISRKNAYTIELQHSHGFGKVGSFNNSPDEAFAAMGVVVGSSVGQDVTEIKLIAPLYIVCKGDGTITKVSPLFDGSVTFDAANSNPSAGTLRFNHPLKSVTAHQAIAASRAFVDGISKPMTIAAFNNDGGTYTQIHAYDEQDESVFIRHNGTAWEAAQGINKAAYSFDFNSTSGLLTITHPTVKSGAYLTNPVITPYKTSNRYAIHSISPTQTGIICYNNTGAVVKTLDAVNWSFFFSIKTAAKNMVLTAIPATNEFTIFVGMCHVPVDNLKNVPSGNVWFSGAMFK